MLLSRLNMCLENQSHFSCENILSSQELNNSLKPFLFQPLYLNRWSRSMWMTFIQRCETWQENCTPTVIPRRLSSSKVANKFSWRWFYFNHNSISWSILSSSRFLQNQIIIKFLCPILQNHKEGVQESCLSKIMLCMTHSCFRPSVQIRIDKIGKKI